MALRVFNRLTRQAEEFVPLVEGQVRMYVCGPTVYDHAHLGHGKTYVSFDVINRYLRYTGYTVRYVQNITDVGHLLDSGEDRVLKRAGALSLEPMEVVETYTRSYFEDMDALGVLRPDISPRATGHVPEQIKMVQGLIEKGHAYVTEEGDVYFDVTTFPEYGKLSGQRLEELVGGARVDVGEHKRNPADFALWRHAEPEHLMKWDSPWGEGFPGWHIECSAMSMKYLGPHFDIHTGGEDNVFPHHENEIAQTEALTGRTFARYWMHNGMLNLKSEKMSKSLGNMIAIDDFLAAHPGDTMRLLVLNGSYRSPLTYSEEIVEQSEQAYHRLLAAKKEAAPGAPGIAPEAARALSEAAENTRQKFIESMNDDFNTSGAMAAIFDLVRAINQARSDGATQAQLTPALEVFNELTSVLGLELSEKEFIDSKADPFIALLIRLRADLRAERNWALADKVRDELKALGVTIEDGKDGTSWSWG